MVKTIIPESKDVGSPVSELVLVLLVIRPKLVVHAALVRNKRHKKALTPTAVTFVDFPGKIWFFLNPTTSKPSYL
ncbi:MAG TPA: hypothetical protein DCS07_11565 [Bdellovibrionales bacterium]|nr:hypothetical protein [Bdellovibrionales bacterium]